MSGENALWTRGLSAAAKPWPRMMRALANGDQQTCAENQSETLYDEGAG